MTKLYRHAEFEAKLLERFGVSDIKVYGNTNLAGDGFIAVRGETVYVVESDSLFSGFDESLFNVLCREIGLMPPLQEWTITGKE